MKTKELRKTVERTDKTTDGRSCERTDKTTDGRSCEGTDETTDGRSCEGTDETTDGRSYEGTDETTGERGNERTGETTVEEPIKEQTKQQVKEAMKEQMTEQTKEQQMKDIQDTMQPKINTKVMTLIAIMTAVTCVLAPLSVPIGPVPISLTNLVIYFGLFVIGMKKETISYVLYLLIGLVGVPVFSGFTAGPAKLVGPTGGYLLGFIPLALIAGYLIERYEGKRIPSVIGMVSGTLVCYALGTAWFCIQAKMSISGALGLCVFPFLPGDAIKIAIAAWLGPRIQKQLRKAQLNV